MKDRENAECKSASETNSGTYHQTANPGLFDIAYCRIGVRTTDIRKIRRECRNAKQSKFHAPDLGLSASSALLGALISCWVTGEENLSTGVTVLFLVLILGGIMWYIFDIITTKEQTKNVSEKVLTIIEDYSDDLLYNAEKSYFQQQQEQQQQIIIYEQSFTNGAIKHR